MVDLFASAVQGLKEIDWLPPANPFDAPFHPIFEQQVDPPAQEM
jgi:hypothetical protein